MDFIVKDLMISLLPLRPTVLNGGFGRNFGSCDAGACTTCTGMTNCPGGCTSVTPHPQLNLYEEIANPLGLATLKQQLREALAAVEAREKVVHEAMRPQSLAEVELLQAHLEAALADLKETAQELSKDKSGS